MRASGDCRIGVWAIVIAAAVPALGCVFAGAVELATEANNHHAIGFATSMRGVVSWFTGEWNDCYERNRDAATIYRDKCSGVAWELTTANTFVLSALVFLGRWREHALTLPDLVQQAEQRGDRYGAVSLPLLAYAYVDDLAADKPAQARTMIREALSAWPDEEFHLQHCDALIGQVETFLYEGDARSACDLLDREGERLKRSNLLQMQLYRILTTALDARAALALAVSGQCSAAQTARMMERARRGARRLSQKRPAWAAAFGNLLGAGISSAEKRPRDAMRSLQAASELFEATRMEHYLAVTRLRMSQLQPDCDLAKSESTRWMNEQGITNSSRIAQMLAPGMW